jgi:hypothetical protein
MFFIFLRKWHRESVICVILEVTSAQPRALIRHQDQPLVIDDAIFIALCCKHFEKCKLVVIMCEGRS